MKIILLGASGMVGQGVLIECLRDRRVERVLALGRSASGRQDPKLKDLVHADFYDMSAVESQLRGYDACFYCLGVSSVGMTESDYTRVTYHMTLSVAQTLVRLNPGMTFTYVSGAGTDSSEQERSMWARVKGRTENALLRLPFKSGLFVPPRRDPAAARRAAEGGLDTGHLCGHKAAAFAGCASRARRNDDLRTCRPGHDQRDRTRGAQPHTGKPRHQQRGVARLVPWNLLRRGLRCAARTRRRCRGEGGSRSVRTVVWP
jgi:NAD-dependent epimerase/dehydratase family protein